MKISVIMPVYNAEKYVGKTLENVRSQTYKDLEIICVLDCPTDSSEQIVNEHAAKDSRVKIIKPEKNLGPGPVRNLGVENATGEYIHFMDADDYLSADFYEQMAKSMKIGADVAACSVFYEARPRHSIWFGKNEVVTGKAKWKKTEIFIHGWLWRYLIRRDFWNARELKFPNLSIMEDMPTMIRMMHYAGTVALCSDAVYFYKDRAGSIVRQNFDMKKRADWMRGRDMIRIFVRRHKIRKPSRLLWQIKHLL